MRDIPTNITITLQDTKYRVERKSLVTRGNTLNIEYHSVYGKILASVGEIYYICTWIMPYLVEHEQMFFLSSFLLRLIQYTWVPHWIHIFFTMALLITDMEAAAAYQQGTLHYGSVVTIYKAGIRVTYCNHLDKSREVRWCFIVMQQHLHLALKLS